MSEMCDARILTNLGNTADCPNLATHFYRNMKVVSISNLPRVLMYCDQHRIGSAKNDHEFGCFYQEITREEIDIVLVHDS
jgi:hypothetical protein